jgi:L,D-peptidoglycan transpeptidase YkuD (ErfK/YbiS/YcfS/YnhG family)
MYDIVVVVGYNDMPPIAGQGSAIFIHVAREGYPPTDGCVAFKKEDLLEILPLLSSASHIWIKK